VAGESDSSAITPRMNSTSPFTVIAKKDLIHLPDEPAGVLSTRAGAHLATQSPFPARRDRTRRQRSNRGLKICATCADSDGLQCNADQRR
jgi:hypothetical protein